MNNIRFIGLDVHKQSISVAVADGGRSRSVKYLGEIDNDPVAIGELCAPADIVELTKRSPRGPPGSDPSNFI